MVFPKACWLCQVAFCVTKNTCNIVPVVLKIVFSKNLTNKVLQSNDCVVVERAVAWQKRYDAIIIDTEQFSIICGMSNMQTRAVETITSHHTTNNVWYKLLEDNVLIPFKLTILYLYLLLLKNGYLIKWDIRCQFVLKTINLDKLTIKFFFIVMELVELFCPFCDKSIHRLFNCTSILSEETDKFVTFEIPRCLMCIPVLFWNFYTIGYIVLELDILYNHIRKLGENPIGHIGSRTNKL